MSEKHRGPAWASPTQLEIASTAIERIEALEERIESMSGLDEWLAVRRKLMEVLETGLPAEAKRSAPDLDARVVSRHTFGDLSIENVLFRSAMGWQIGGTVFRPAGSKAFPGVVCPTGSSTKLNYPYWSSAQLIARSGYVVLSYDPPGFVGERRERSDMFAHAPLGYLTGLLARGFFVADNAAAIDYLASRSDVTHAPGYGVTGLSLGAQTTVNAAIHDCRIRFIAPICGIQSNLESILSELNSVCCIDMVPDIMLAGMDGFRRLSLCAPVPCLLVTGAKDEVFSAEVTRRVYEKTQRVYGLYGETDGFELFVDPEVGHTYSAAMVNEVATRLDKVLKGVSPSASGCAYGYTSEDIIDIPVDAMKAYPDTSVNVCSLNEARIHRSTAGRHPDDDASTLARLLRLDTGVARRAVCTVVTPPVRVWVHDITRMRIDGDGFSIPSLLVARAGISEAPGLVFIDEAGIWAGISGHSYLARAFRTLERTESETEPIVLTIDAAGFGSLSHRESVYDAVSWSDPDSTLAYLGFAAGRPVAGLRVRDALCALEILSTRPEVDTDRLMIAGVGEGAITALCASVVYDGCCRTILVDPPLSFKEIVRSGDHLWPRTSFIPGILDAFDLPDLVRSVFGEVRIIRPMDAGRKPVTLQRAMGTYGKGDGGPIVTLPAGLSERNDAFVAAVLAPAS